LNKNLARLRVKAEDRLGKIMELAKHDKKLQAKLEESIEKFQKMRIEANEKVGRSGAMKAQKRLL
jgi:tellurite resistance protein